MPDGTHDTNLDDTQKAALIDAMKRDSGTTRAIDAGYTYLGQFISHEIVPPTDPANGNGHNVTPRLDLDSLYNGTPEWRERAIQGGRFRIGSTDEGTMDLLRDKKNVADIPQARNDENVIVAQLHVFWQRLHNHILDRGFAKDYRDARKLTTKVFQLIVVEDYLRLVLEPRVFQAYFREGQRRLGFDRKTIAPQFARAAFRFGHSMVRSSYEFVVNVPTELKDLFQMSKPLPRNLLIDWSRFFGLPGAMNGAQDAALIDPRVSPAMTAIKQPSGEVNIIEKNLKAGESLGPGKAYAQQLLKNTPELADDFGLKAHDKLWEDLDQVVKPVHIDSNNLPFWPYILNEAILEGGGHRLGVLGSLICAETLANAITESTHCIWPDPDRHPTDLDAVLDDLGAQGGGLGACIRNTMLAHPVKAPASQTMGRTFCMRHLIELMNTDC